MGKYDIMSDFSPVIIKKPIVKNSWPYSWLTSPPLGFGFVRKYFNSSIIQAKKLDSLTFDYFHLHFYFENIFKYFGLKWIGIGL